MSAIALLGCPERVVRLGVVVPLTGVDQSYGESVRRGVELAWEELSEDPGAPVMTIEYADSGSDPENARQLVAEQYERGALVTIGGVTSEEAQSMLTEADRFDRVLLSPSASAPGLSGASPNFYRIVPSGYTEAVKMADFARRELKVKKAVVIAERRSYALGLESVFAPSFAKAGGKVMETIEIPAASDDVTAAVERALELAPDAVYLAAYETGAAAVIRELRHRGYKGRILATRTFARRSSVALAGDDAVGVLLTHSVAELDLSVAQARRFVAAYRARYGEPPDIFAAYGYDAMKVLAAAMEGRVALASELRKGLRDAIREFPGVTGVIQFNDRGDVSQYPRVYTIGDDLELHEYGAWMQERQRAVAARLQGLERQIASLHP